MSKTIVITNNKGGVGKTQTTIELAYYLVSIGKSVLVLDLDPQANATFILSEGQPKTWRTLPDILISGNTITDTDIYTRRVDVFNSIDYVPSGITVGRLEKKLPDNTPKEYLLLDALEGVKEHYDYILIDTPPSVELINIMSLVAATDVIITTSASALSYEGIKTSTEIVSAVKSNPRMNTHISILGIVVTMFEPTKDSKKTLDDIKTHFGDLITTPFIRKCVKVQEASRHMMPAQAYAPNCSSAIDYRLLFNSIFHKTNI